MFGNKSPAVCHIISGALAVVITAVLIVIKKLNLVPADLMMFRTVHWTQGHYFEIFIDNSHSLTEKKITVTDNDLYTELQCSAVTFYTLCRCVLTCVEHRQGQQHHVGTATRAEHAGKHEENWTPEGRGQQSACDTHSWNTHFSELLHVSENDVCVWLLLTNK